MNVGSVPSAARALSRVLAEVPLWATSTSVGSAQCEVPRFDSYFAMKLFFLAPVSFCLVAGLFTLGVVKSFWNAVTIHYAVGSADHTSCPCLRRPGHRREHQDRRNDHDLRGGVHFSSFLGRDD